MSFLSVGTPNDASDLTGKGGGREGGLGTTQPCKAPPLLVPPAGPQAKAPPGPQFLPLDEVKVRPTS